MSAYNIFFYSAFLVKTRSQRLAESGASITARSIGPAPNKIYVRRCSLNLKSKVQNKNQPKKITSRRATLAPQSNARNNNQPKKTVAHRENSVAKSSVRDENQPKKISARRATIGIQSIVRSKDQPKPISARRVSFSGVNTVHSFDVNMAPNRRGNEFVLNAAKGNRLAMKKINEQIRTQTRSFDIRLKRLLSSELRSQAMPNKNVPQQDVSKNVGQSNGKLSHQERNNSVGLSICQDCAESFDSILQRKRETYIAPYEKMLQKEQQANEDAQKQLDEIEKRWNMEAMVCSRLTADIDNTQAKWAALLQKNLELQSRVGCVSAAVLHDHNYARAQQ